MAINHQTIGNSGIDVEHFARRVRRIHSARSNEVQEEVDQLDFIGRLEEYMPDIFEYMSSCVEVLEDHTHQMEREIVENQQKLLQSIELSDSTEVALTEQLEESTDLVEGTKAVANPVEDGDDEDWEFEDFDDEEFEKIEDEMKKSAWDTANESIPYEPKILYRRICQLCHPDKQPRALTQKGVVVLKEVFHESRKVYETGDKVELGFLFIVARFFRLEVTKIESFFAPVLAAMEEKYVTNDFGDSNLEELIEFHAHEGFSERFLSLARRFMALRVRVYELQILGSGLKLPSPRPALLKELFN
jgi:hypothetical protein